ncbi:putative nucleolar protein C2C4.08 [Hypsizygus marmoreus]|uniref:Nucleolar protein C2C4.08 n=1 Tax=Hypsizygus marmoreus TaxID=39966 RepID=A0A369JR41_HYPMA|nr:putative nucleolar protein C2C4.08 [Hypsizygus marmoreus]
MARDTPIITGYYRYTDIWFEWSSALPNPEDARPLKAILAHDSIVHPDHPLHIEGVQGVQMYLGTFVTGEARLLFSSAQVDYLRYWLHAMQLTKEIIPLPYSDCLLTESDLRNVSPVVYPDGGALRNSLKKIDKNNKRLKGSNPILTSRREIFERVRSYWAEKKGVWCSIDFEAWELDHTVITEFGWRYVAWKDGEEIHEAGHLIVDEHQKYRNSKYVPERRYDYGFGESQIVKRSSFKTRICALLEQLPQHGPVFLVFHDNNQDIKYLRSPSIAAPLDGMSYVLPDAMPDEGLFVVDTSDLFAALEGAQTADRRALVRMCNLIQIPTSNLHNAGNDAHYTLQALLEMASGDPVDIQREKRWPNRTGDRGVKVEFKPYEEDSDYSDEEGLVPPSSKYYTPQ